ncbi:enoyl-CoA hydratase [Rhodococcus sp. 06-156-3C]|uniref:crotonase/enoyl-CoA hydratase family protein n=1 Tax=Nocardiaceae TaxID=85025 RepID=UPI000522EE23|nr:MULTISPECIES: crotonase/enoyl-CoA hydratase family protein [Rhodococcus]OZD13047.1 enoyl-CoA hydratase [Rhodococcus sp. 06-156-4a]OZD17916.1 enoyl-CoA hydratase [Rhodococcus sp. 06-156-3C]OZD20640.1 enoyl-CoA hydratase [Rhodococcus sp. 06-156-4C]OZD30642.1 enoyl-CoA hydratase [Rhodococcus sp. 06-156-3b]OZD32586.1 enoyl-CoA hydratase [Rhodococcus sp. 06-156-3]
MTSSAVTVDRDGHILLIGLNRPDKRNAFTTELITELSRAFATLEQDRELRAGVLFAHGDHFTAGLDMVDVAGCLVDGNSPIPEDGMDPWRLDYRWKKPIVAAAHGWCMTLGIELLLAADIRIAAAGTRFSQLEVKRGIYPFGGATLRFWREAGWGNAMRWLLTGDEFGADEALRIGLVQEICDDAESARERAIELAKRIAEHSAPLGVAATLASAHRSRDEGNPAAAQSLTSEVSALFATADAAEGFRSFVERRDAKFTGH